MRPGTGAHIARDMRPRGPISLGIWAEGGGGRGVGAKNIGGSMYIHCYTGT